MSLSNTTYNGRVKMEKSMRLILKAYFLGIPQDFLSFAKIYAQKGTGNARHASRKAPIFVGGGVAHGPKGESKYKKRKLNKI